MCVLPKNCLSCIHGDKTARKTVYCRKWTFGFNDIYRKCEFHFHKDNYFYKSLKPYEQKVFEEIERSFIQDMGKTENYTFNQKYGRLLAPYINNY